MAVPREITAEERAEKGYSSPIQQTPSLNSANLWVVNPATAAYEAMMQIQENKLEMMQQVSVQNQAAVKATQNAALANALETESMYNCDATLSTFQAGQSFGQVGGAAIGASGQLIGRGAVNEASQNMQGLEKLQVAAENTTSSPLTIGEIDTDAPEDLAGSGPERRDEEGLAGGGAGGGPERRGSLERTPTRDLEFEAFKQAVKDGRISDLGKRSIDEKILIKGNTKRFSIKDALEGASNEIDTTDPSVRTEREELLKTIADAKKYAQKKLNTAVNNHSSKAQSMSQLGQAITAGSGATMQLFQSSTQSNKAEAASENTRAQTNTSFSREIARQIESSQEQYAKEANDAMDSLRALISLSRPG